MQHNILILSTRPLSHEVMQEATEKGIALDVKSFIHTEPCINEVRDEVIEMFGRGIIAIFTSMSAVEAVVSLKGDRPLRWKIFCIGDATAALVGKHFGEEAIVGRAGNAQALANVILKHAIVTEAVYFCGDIRRPELPAALAKQHIKIKEIVVYCTKLTPLVTEKKYDGILFFSPSGVESFFSVNSIDKDTILFAIGRTTGEAIKKLSANRIITGTITGKDELARQAMEYFITTRTIG